MILLRLKNVTEYWQSSLASVTKLTGHGRKFRLHLPSVLVRLPSATTNCATVLLSGFHFVFTPSEHRESRLRLRTHRLWLHISEDCCNICGLKISYYCPWTLAFMSYWKLYSTLYFQEIPCICWSRIFITVFTEAAIVFCPQPVKSSTFTAFL